MLFAQLPTVQVTLDSVALAVMVCTLFVLLLVVLNERATNRVKRAGRLESTSR